MGARTRGFANNVLTSGKLDATDGLTGNLASTNFANATVTNIEELPPAVGSAISSVAGNPAAPVAVGKIWYNTNTDSFNIAATLEAWSSGAPLSVSRNYVKGCGTQTAALTYSGYTGTAPTTSTEEYNGSGWTTGGNMGAGAYSIQAYGTQTAAVQSGSYPNNADTEEYDGSAWTAGGNLNTGRGEGAGFGILTAGVVAGGFNPGPTSLSTVEHYDGTSYSSATSMSNARRADFGAAGIQTAGLAVSGPPSGTAVEEYDGTTWTAGGAHPSSLSQHCATGTQTDALVYGVGPPPAPTQTTKYDGTTWTVSPATLATGRRLAAGAGADGSSALLSGGYIDGPNVRTNLTEEYNVSLNVITGAAWASGGNLNNATRGGAGIGTRDAAIAAGGITGSPAPAGPGRPGLSEEYNGTSWSNLPTIGRSPSDSAFVIGGCGTSTAGLIAGGMPGGQGQVANTDEWDGSSWTAGGAMNDARQSPELAGVQTQALVTGGRDDPGPVKSTSEIYNGTSWTTDASMSNARDYHGSGGTTSAAWVAGAQTGTNTLTENYDGTSWTASGALVAGTYGAGMGGPQTSAHMAGGGSPYINTTQHYDGTIWVTAPSISSARRNVFSSPNVADTSTAMIAGGTPAPTNVQSTEEFTGETSALNVESLTTS